MGAFFHKIFAKSDFKIDNKNTESDEVAFLAGRLS